MADDVQVKFGAQLDGLIAGVNDAKEQIAEFGETVSSGFERINTAAEAVASIMAGGIFKAFVDEANDAVSQALQLSQRLGITSEQASGLRVALGNVGIGTDEFLGIMQRMDRQLKTNEASFNAMGVVTRDVNGNFRSQSTILQDVIEKLETFKAGTDRNEASMVLLGGRVGDLTNLMRLNKDALAEGEDEARRLGLVFGDDAVRGMLQYKKSMAEVDEVTLSFKVKLAQELEPTLTGFAEWMKTEGPSAIGAFTSAVQGALVGITYLITGIKQLINTAKELSEETSSGGKAGILGQLGADMGLVSQEDVDNAIIHANSIEADYKAKAGQIAQDGKKAYMAIFGLDESGNPLPKPKIDLPNEGTSTFAGAGSVKGDSEGKEDDSAEKDEIAIERSDLQTSLELYRLDVAAKKDADDAKVASGKLSKQAELADLISLVGQERELALKEITDERDLYDQDSVNWVELDNKKLVAEQQYANEIARLSAQMAQAQAQAAKKSAEEWKPVLDTIGRDFDSMLQGVLQGTETWQQAMGKLFSNIAVSAVEAIAKITAEWLIFMVATEGQGTWSSFVALEKPGGAGVSSLLPSFDVGSWSVPQTGPAFIHAGEMIIPASHASAIRSGDAGMGTSGSAGNFTININAIDTQTGAQFLKQNASVIAQSMAGQMRNFNSSLRN